MQWSTIILTSFLVTFARSARILCIIPMPSYSHQVVYQSLWREMSLRGHQVTVITSDPVKNPKLTNLTEIDTSFQYKELEKQIVPNDMRSFNRFQMYHNAMHLGAEFVNQQLHASEVQALINNKTEHFDAIIAELHFPLVFAFAERFKCPLIAVSTVIANSRIYNALGNSYHPLITPEGFSPSEDYSTIYDRFLHVAFSFYIKHLSNYLYSELQDEIIKKYFGAGYPTVGELEKKVSLIFINTDLVFFNIHPVLPNIVSIGGGIHVGPTKPLPKDLQQLCDDAKNGFIYFSLGGNVKSHLLPRSTIQNFLEVFGQVPYTIFWKIEVDKLIGKPKNVILRKRFPQLEMLRHSNIKLFITQGGLQSLHESVLSSVPILGIPIIADQRRNLERIVKKEMGLALVLESITKESLHTSIVEVIKNPKYLQNVKKYAELLQDEPIGKLERAVWWTEHIIRHKGAQHLRSPAADLPFYQYFLLDVIGICLALFTLFIVIFAYFFKLLIQILNRLLGKKGKLD